MVSLQTCLPLVPENDLLTPLFPAAPPSTDSSFFISLKSNQRSLLSDQKELFKYAWKILGTFSAAEELPWAISSPRGNRAGFVFPWCSCTISRPSGLMGQEYEVRNWILIFSVAASHAIMLDDVVLASEKRRKLTHGGVCT